MEKKLYISTFLLCVFVERKRLKSYRKIDGFYMYRKDLQSVLGWFVRGKRKIWRGRG